MCHETHRPQTLRYPVPTYPFLTLISNVVHRQHRGHPPRCLVKEPPITPEIDCRLSFRAQGPLACFLDHLHKKVLLALPLRALCLHRDLTPITRLSTWEAISHLLLPLPTRWMVVRTKGTLLAQYHRVVSMFLERFSGS